MRRVILRSFLLVFLICTGCILYGLLVEPRQLKIRDVEFVSEAYKGPALRIGLITDIHIGGMHMPPQRVEKLVDEMNALKPDVVLLPGDFVNGHLSREETSDAFNTEIETGIQHLADLQAPSFASLGNHDAWYDAPRIKSYLEEAGVTVLDNEAAIFKGLCLVGLADEHTARPDKAVFSQCPDDKNVVVLTHSPQAWRAFRSDTALAVAGHTHGGQVNLPFLGRRVNSTNLGPQHSYGFSKLGGVDVFVSAGVGTSILPVRFRSPPEIVVITLRGIE